MLQSTTLTPIHTGKKQKKRNERKTGQEDKGERVSMILHCDKANTFFDKENIISL